MAEPERSVRQWRHYWPEESATCEAESAHRYSRRELSRWRRPANSPGPWRAADPCSRRHLLWLPAWSGFASQCFVALARMGSRRRPQAEADKTRFGEDAL